MGKVGKEGEEKGNCVEVLEYSGLECGMLGCWELWVTLERVEVLGRWGYGRLDYRIYGML